MKRDILGKVRARLTGQDDITNSAKIFKVYTAKPIADAVKDRLKVLSQLEQVKQNEDSAKEATKLVKPITANDKFQQTSKLQRNSIERLRKLIELGRETG